MSIYKYDELKVKDLKTLFESGFEAIIDGNMKHVIVRKPICELCENPDQPIHRDNVCEKCWSLEKTPLEDLL